MFDALKGMAGLGSLMKDLPRIRERLERARAELADMTVQAEGGGGAVVVVADGRMRIRSVKIDPAMLLTLIDDADASDQRMAEDLITNAVNDALERAQTMIGDHLKHAAGEMGLALPPGGIPGLL
jgi:DNA-binding YbaB/EbfC family protein